MVVHKIVIETDFSESTPQELYEDNPQRKKEKEKETPRKLHQDYPQKRNKTKHLLIRLQ